MSSIIQIHDLGKRYHRRGNPPYLSLRELVAGTFRRSPRQSARDAHFWALRGVDLQVEQGDRVGVIGRNGAGKSTLLKILSRITPPTTGSVVLNGRVASLLEVGTGFHPELTGRENIFLNGSILGLTKAEVRQKMEAIIDFSGVSDFVDTPLKHYSSGMQLRLAFSVAAHLEPEILLIDEVLAVGDLEFQKKCMGKMAEISQDKGRTIIFVSHNLGAVRQLCNKGALLERGQLLAYDTAGRVIDQYILKEEGAGGTRFRILDEVRPGNAPGLVAIREVCFNRDGPIRHGHALSVQLQLQAAKPARDLVAAVGFNNLEGSRILSIDTDNSFGGDKTFSLPQAGTYSLELHLPHCYLQPGTYFISLALRSPDAAISYEYLQHIAVVEVLPGDTTPDVIISHQYQGGVRPPVDWKILT